MQLYDLAQWVEQRRLGAGHGFESRNRVEAPWSFQLTFGDGHL